MPSPSRHDPRLLLAALLAVASLSACHDAPKAPPLGVARVVASCQGSCAQIAEVRVTVSAGAGSAFTPITATVPTTGSGQWSLRLTGIPAGPGRLFEVSARDAAGAVLLSGSARADILPGRATVVSIVLQGASPPVETNRFPVIDSLTYRSHALPGEAMAVSATAHDPDPQDTLRWAWRATCGTFDAADRRDPVWTAPAAEGPCALSVTASDQRGAATTATFSVAVTTQLGDAAVSVLLRSWPVITSFSGAVRMTADLEGELSLFATSPDGDPLEVAWTTDCPGATLDLTPPFGPTFPHFRVPGPSAACAITATVATSWSRPAGTTATFGLPPNLGISTLCTNRTCPPGQACDPADGACRPTGATCADVTCAPIDACHEAGTCDDATLTCLAGPARTCPSDAPICDPGDGLCKARCATVTCPPASDRCHQAGACVEATGTCAPEVATTCPAGQQCDPADGACRAPGAGAAVPVADAARAVPLPAVALAADATGAAYLAGPLLGSRSFDAFSISSAGSADLALVRYDPATHLPTWAQAFGGGAPEATAATDQLPVAAAVTGDGTLVVVGGTSGNLVVNPTTTIAVASPQDFILLVDAATGAGRGGRAVDNGNGVLLAVAANPRLDVFAVCGYAADAVSSLAPPGAVFGGGTGASARDAVVALFGSSGTLLWSKQLGSPSPEECDAVAIDDAGDVYVAGKYGTVTGQASLDPGLGALPATGLGTRRFVWVAKYRGADGAPLAQASFGAGNGNQTPTTLAVDAAGEVVLGGTFAFSLPFGATTLVASGQDAFVARLGPSLAPRWAVRLGGPGSTDVVAGVAITASGQVLATGTVAGTTTGAAALVTAAGSDDAFLLELDGATGATLFAAVYGDGNGQAGAGVQVGRLSALDPELVEVAGTFAGSIAFDALPPLTSLAGDAFLLWATLR